MDMGDLDTTLDGMFSQMTSVSPAQSNALHQNNQRLIMAELPALSMLEGEPTNLYASFNILNHVGLPDCDELVLRNALLGRIIDSNPSCPNISSRIQERFVGGMPVSAEFGTSAPSACPLEISRTSQPNDYCDALNSSLLTSMNCGYDGLLGLNSSNKFLDCPDPCGKVPGRMGFQSFQFLGDHIPNGWISSENSNPSGSSLFSNELSLSLATCQPSIIHGTSIQDQSSEMSFLGVSHHSLNDKQLGSETSCNSKNLSLSSSSCRPVELPQYLSGSGYLRVIQEILAEIASYSLENLIQMNYPASGIGAGARFSFSSSRHTDRDYAVVGSDDFPNGGARFDVRMELVEAKKQKLLDLLQVVDERYNQCLDEIHTVISAFHAATELDPHIPARFALQTISSLYKNVRDRISSQILKMGAFCNKGGTGEGDRSFEASFIQKRWALQQLQRKDHQLWRPQRGLPERSVSVLRAWMFQNFLHPYPKDAEKHLLAVRSGLTRSQVSNWFINARVRLWKPMIEEMYADMNRRKARRNDEETDSNGRRRFDMN